MKVFRISKCNFINDLSGTAAALYGGRWHSKGTHVLYTAASPSLAMLESVVLISNIQTTGFCLICLEVPETSVQTILIKDLPAGWFANPAPDILKMIGDAFIKEHRYLALCLPSAIMPEENNYLLNPQHVLFKEVKALYQKMIPVDERLLE